MKVVVAIDSFKGSLSSMEAGQAIAEGVKRVHQNAEVVVRPLADGGEGTVEALVEGMGGIFVTKEVTGPLGEKVEAVYGVIESKEDSSKTAIIEMSAAAGITLVFEESRNPMNTTTYGVGELILDAIERGCRRFIVGIGGSATNDGGIGMLQALGYDFLTREGKAISYGGDGLRELASIEDVNVHPKLKECTFKVACDVTNPLCGENGSSAIFGPQKGATPEMVQELDQLLLHYAELSKNIHSNADRFYPGTGAAGGMGFAFLTYTNATLESGIQIVLTETKLEELIATADFVVTGEGRLDGQTALGKAPIGVASLAKKHQKKVLAFAGAVTPDAKECNQHGIDAFFPILRGVVTLKEAMNKEVAHQNMVDTVEQVFRVVEMMKEGK
ncbi:glycerate kinase [Granulicatella elegans]|uniref:glycerate kinase family protein n=1 Tax=Granulicatella elegans TaxID=137732 RepID=UPI001D133AF2|nr:glycerate kinase [Granulicatella elegans]UEA31581.1 glycerate kinase [Granulicatella elegans]